MTILRWQGIGIKKNQQPRKYLQNWSIPKHYREKYWLPDGMSLDIVIKHMEITSRVNITLTSGGEFILPLHTALSFNPQEAISFEIDLEANAKSMVEIERLSRRASSKETRYNEQPKEYLSTVRLFYRNPTVVAEALCKANGTCTVCRLEAPFRRISGEPYLEVHHVHWLANGGLDRIENTIALCPNCHREAHHGDPKLWAMKLPEKLRRLALNNVQRQTGE